MLHTYGYFREGYEFFTIVAQIVYFALEAALGAGGRRCRRFPNARRRETIMTEGRKVAAEYARYSSGLQNPKSIDDQLARTHPAAIAAGYQVPPDYTLTDCEISGSDEDRPGYRRVMELARAKKITAIFAEDQSRLWRSQREMHRAIALLKFWGVKVFCVASNTELTSVSGRLLASVVAWKDEAYLEDLSDRTHRGLAGQARRGYSAGGRTFGYTTVPEIDHAHLDSRGQPRVVGYRRVKHPEEAPIVLRVFEAFAAGCSLRKMTRQFNVEKVRSPRGTSWTPSAIYGSPRLGTGILRNPLYRGQIVWNRFAWQRNPETGARVPRLRDPSEWIVQQDESLRIVSEDLWARVERRLRGAAGTSARRAHPGGSPHRYPLSGLLVCGVCGAHYVMRGGSSYACSFHLNRGPSVCSNARFVSRRLQKTGSCARCGKTSSRRRWWSTSPGR